MFKLSNFASLGIYSWELQSTTSLISPKKVEIQILGTHVMLRFFFQFKTYLGGVEMQSGFLF